MMARKRYNLGVILPGDTVPANAPPAAVAAATVEGDVVSRAQHELGLDEFIRSGRDKLLRGEMTITATNYLQAIKIKSDNEKNTKDRRLEMIKNFFSGGDKNDSPA